MNEDETIKKFIENMRATGQPDDVIAQNLIDAGHNELAVLNLFGVSDISELTDDEDDETDETTPSSVQSVFTAVDAEGNPLISEDNMPRVIGGEDHTPKPKPKPKPSISRSRPRSGRIYPRPKARPVSTPVEQKQPKAKKEEEPQLEHHTYEDFMHRIEEHDELELGDEHNLPAGHSAAVSQEPTPADVEDLPEDPSRELPKPLPAEDTQPLKPAKNDYKKPAAKNIDELLETQKEEAAEGESGPDMDDLLDEKDMRELEETEPPKAQPTKEATDANKTPDTPELQKVAHSLENLQQSSTLKVFIILGGVIALIILASAVMVRITS